MGHLINHFGDLLDSDCSVIAHQANCRQTMSSGIAKSIKARYPEAYQADLNFKGTPEQRLGNCSSAYVDNKQRVVVNLYGQLNYGRNDVHTDYLALSSAMVHCMRGLEKLEKKGFVVTFGVPYYMGCGLGGGDWHKVLEILHSAAKHYNRNIYIYRLN